MLPAPVPRAPWSVGGGIVTSIVLCAALGLGCGKQADKQPGPVADGGAGADAPFGGLVRYTGALGPGDNLVTVMPGGYTGQICIGEAGCTANNLPKELPLADGTHVIYLPWTADLPRTTQNAGTITVSGVGTVVDLDDEAEKYFQPVVMTGTRTSELRARTVVVQLNRAGFAGHIDMYAAGTFVDGQATLIPSRVYGIYTAFSGSLTDDYVIDFSLDASGHVVVLNEAERQTLQESGPGSSTLVAQTVPITLVRNGWKEMFALYGSSDYFPADDVSSVHALKARRYSFYTPWSSHKTRGTAIQFASTYDLTVDGAGVMSLHPELEGFNFATRPGNTIAALTVPITIDMAGYRGPAVVIGIDNLTVEPMTVLLMRARRYDIRLWFTRQLDSWSEETSDEADITVHENGTVSVDGEALNSFEATGPDPTSPSVVRAKVKTIRYQTAGHPGALGVYGVAPLDPAGESILMMGRRYRMFAHFSWSLTSLEGFFSPEPDVTVSPGGEVTLSDDGAASFSWDAETSTFRPRTGVMTITPVGYSGPMSVYAHNSGPAGAPLQTTLQLGHRYRIDPTETLVAMSAEGVCSPASIPIPEGGSLRIDCRLSQGGPISCSGVAQGTPCDDGNACTEGTVCNGSGQCAGGSPRSCDDGRVCTVDSCAPATGCSFAVPSGGESCAPEAALLVVKTTAVLLSSDVLLRDRLQGLGFSVSTVGQGTAQTADADGKKLIVISGSVDPEVIAARFTAAPVPLLSLDRSSWDDLGMTPGASGGVAAQQDAVTIVEDRHPLAGGRAPGPVPIAASATSLGWGAPAASAFKVAAIAGQSDQAVIFGYEGGATMAAGTAPARRAGWLAGPAVPEALNVEGWRLFDAAVMWTAGRTGRGTDICLLPRAIRSAGRFDLKVARADPEWKSLIDGFAADPEIAPTLSVLASECGLDAVAQIDSIMIGWTGVGWLPFVNGAVEFGGVAQGTWDATRLRDCLNGARGEAAPTFAHGGVTVHGGDADHPFFALLNGTTLAFASTRPWITEVVDSFAAAPAAACSGGNPALAATLQRTDTGSALWLVGAFSAEDQAGLRDSEAIAWADRTTRMAATFKARGGLSVLLDLTTGQAGETDAVVTKATNLFARLPRPPAGILESLLTSTTVTRPAPTEARFRTALSLDQFRRLIGYATSTDDCVNGFAQAVRSFTPPAEHDGQSTLPGPRSFKIPPHLRVVEGNAGNHQATLTYRLGSEGAITCRYQGGGSSSHPTEPADVAAGQRYNLQSCSNGASAGALVRADWLRLHLEGADAQAGRAAVRAPLVCL
jgi:hypothetical protein